MAARSMALPLPLLLSISVTATAAEGTEQLVAKGAKDLVLSGGATVVNEGFDTCLRSATPVAGRCHQTANGGRVDCTEPERCV